MIGDLLPRATLGAGAILRWHLVGHWLDALGGGGIARALDAGCGRGEYVVRIARRFPGASLVVGVDQTGRDGVSGFAELPADVAGRVLLRQGRFSRAAVEDVAPFDALLCIDVLEHVSDDRSFLADLAAVSRRGARGLVHVPATPQRHPVGWTRRELGRMLADGSGEHVREGYTLTGIAALLEQTGWLVRQARATFGHLAAWWCDADFYLAHRRAHGVRLAALPLTVTGALAGRVARPRRGNGWLLLIERRRDDR
jgi:SAM-dependent methyltransferase